MATLVRWTSTRTPFDRFFEDLWKTFPTEERQEGVASPALDVIDAEDHVEVRVNLPGVSPDSVNIEFDDGILRISSEVRREENEQKVNYTRRERFYGSYKRALRVPETLDTANAEARFENGVLYLTLPKKPEAQPIRIPVKVGTSKK